MTVVRRISGQPETLAIFCTVLVLLGSLAGYVLTRPANPGRPPLLGWQVGSFDGLGPADQAIHGALLSAAEEITWFNNDTGGWITLEEAERMRLPPFYHDVFWKTNGEVRWQLILPGAHHGTPATASQNAVFEGTKGQGATVYYGSAGRARAQGAYLLVIGHAHAGAMWTNQATIWIHRDAHAPCPDIVKAEALVGQGWRQVIAYNGASEVERLKGTP
ncbi:DUF6162 family protein [Burkholderia sp. LMU1-1-1.1]|uniref:DUF6162 family protein n=1 Tax=Burkholderia sp. LMU1-1-1.1 TaxID=3135266 RepID=UPI00341E0E81